MTAAKPTRHSLQDTKARPGIHSNDNYCTSVPHVANDFQQTAASTATQPMISMPPHRCSDAVILWSACSLVNGALRVTN